jgi:hypothetical protein
MLGFIWGLYKLGILVTFCMCLYGQYNRKQELRKLAKGNPTEKNTKQYAELQRVEHRVIIFYAVLSLFWPTIIVAILNWDVSNFLDDMIDKFVLYDVEEKIL